MKYILIILTILVVSFFIFKEKDRENLEDFDFGYDTASENDIDSFEDCEDNFGVGDAEDGCNEYVKDNYTVDATFHGYECGEDCSGHEAGYNWAEQKGISDIDSCTGYSDSFIEGCTIYVEENY